MDPHVIFRRKFYVILKIFDTTLVLGFRTLLILI